MGDDTIVFFNDSSCLHYARAEAQVDVRSGVICLPNNFDYGLGRALPEGIVRCTCLASYDQWAHLPDDTYWADKRRWYTAIQHSAQPLFAPPPVPEALARATLATDMFTPRTITKYTGHFGGAIYGSPNKNRPGRTRLTNVYLCGTDQGFLGIVGGC